MQNETIRSAGCKVFSSSSSSSTTNFGTFEAYVMKNNTKFYELFQPITVCYGNMYEQSSLIVGYLVRAVSMEKEREMT